MKIKAIQAEYERRHQNLCKEFLIELFPEYLIDRTFLCADVLHEEDNLWSVCYRPEDKTNPISFSIFFDFGLGQRQRPVFSFYNHVTDDEMGYPVEAENLTNKFWQKFAKESYNDFQEYCKNEVR